jgi:hypothetical protein
MSYLDPWARVQRQTIIPAKPMKPPTAKVTLRIIEHNPPSAATLRG